MTHTKYRVEIDFQAQNSPSDQKSRQRTHSISENFDEIEEAKKFVRDRTGIENLKESGKPSYVDRGTEDGIKQVKSGKVYSYWNEYSDRSRGTYNVWETAWVKILELEIDEMDIDKI